MTADIKARAEARTETAIAESEFEDFRPGYRERLRQLREEKPTAFTEALRYFEDRLLPVVADEASDPLIEWAAYGKRLGELTGSGKTMSIDATGRARPYETGMSPTELVLHLPNDTNTAALPLLVPRELSMPQRASFGLLVSRARALNE